MENSIICPVCLGIPEQEIYQCTNGHIVCSICVSKLTSCPQCRTVYGTTRIRARVLEELLDNQHFDCFYKERGCVQKSTRKDRRLHEKSCCFNPDNITLCKLVGYGNCNFNVKSLSRAEIISHFESIHLAVIENGSSFNIHHKNYNTLLREDFNGYWSPVFFTSGENETSPLFLLVAKSCPNSEISWICINIWKNESTIQNYEARFSVKTDTMPRTFGFRKELFKFPDMPSAAASTASACLPFETSIDESGRKVITKTKPFTFSLRGRFSKFVTHEENLILNILIQGDSTGTLNICSNALGNKDIWTFFLPDIHDEEMKVVAAKLQQARSCQKQSQIELKKQNEAILAKMKQLELQHDDMKMFLIESERKLVDEHKRQQLSRQVELENRMRCLEKETKIKQEKIKLRENEMLERHMMERQKLNEEKLAIQREQEFTVTNFEKEMLQKSTLNLLIVERSALKQKHVTMEHIMNEEMSLLSIQLSEKENAEKESVKKQKQIDMQIQMLEEQMLQELRLEKQILQKNKQIDAQKKEFEEQVMGKNNEMLARLTLEQRRLESQKQKNRIRIKSEINQL